MLKELSIQNIILIEHAQIEFESGFTVISGESGSGKSAVMEALKLALGERADPDLIRHGAEKASVTAFFDLNAQKECRAFLQEKGIDLDEDQQLLIKREIHRSGKSRAFLNHQPIQLALLKQIGELLVEMVGQHANQKLFSLDAHRGLLDKFGGLETVLSEYTSVWLELQKLENDLKSRKELLPQSFREIDACKSEIEEIDNAAVKEGEEEEIFAEYSHLSSAEERLGFARTLEQTLSGDRGVLSQLNRNKNAAQGLLQKDPAIAEPLQLYFQMILEADELIHALRKYTAHLEADPSRLLKLNDRLSLLNRMKRKYGATLEAILTYRKERHERLQSLENLEQEVEALEETVRIVNEKARSLATHLSTLRKEVAHLLEKKMTLELHALNMRNASFHVQINAEELRSTGSDRIEFFLTSNLGEKPIPIKDGASGGELARILLALQVLLIGKEAQGTLIFDEVDANIGGTTASIVGKNLKAISKKTQVICITHFPQVAKWAEHHFQISKFEKSGRTFSEITILDQNAKEHELARMAGG